MTALPERFAGLPEAERWSEVQGWLWERRIEEIAGLPVAERRELIAALAARCDGHAGLALAKLYLATPLDAEFIAAERGAEERLAADLSGDRTLAAARKGWPTLGPNQRIAALARVVEQVAAAARVMPPAVAAAWTEAEGGFLNLAEYDPENRTVRFNAGEDGMLESFAASFEHALHEARHHVQLRLCESIDPADPRAAQLRLFAANRDAYLTPEAARMGGYLEARPIEVYRAQPLEADASRFAASVIGLMARPAAAARPAPARPIKVAP